MRSKVVDAARGMGLGLEVKTLSQPAYTLPETAATVGCEAASIAKSVVFLADGEPVVCITSGARWVDPDRLCDVLDCAHVEAASPSEVRVATGFAPGAVPPVGHGLRVVIDEVVLGFETMWASCGDGASVFEVHPRELADCTAAEVAPLSE